MQEGAGTFILALDAAAVKLFFILWTYPTQDCILKFTKDLQRKAAWVHVPANYDTTPNLNMDL